MSIEFNISSHVFVMFLKIYLTVLS